MFLGIQVHQKSYTTTIFLLFLLCQGKIYIFNRIDIWSRGLKSSRDALFARQRVVPQGREQRGLLSVRADLDKRVKPGLKPCAKKTRGRESMVLVAENLCLLDSKAPKLGGLSVVKF